MRGSEKRRIGDDDQDRGKFARRLGELSQRPYTAVYAWALMTKHARILLQCGQQDLSAFMRKLLMGYAVGYHLRHRRHGHLFQNRYTSIAGEQGVPLREPE